MNKTGLLKQQQQQQQSNLLHPQNKNNKQIKNRTKNSTKPETFPKKPAKLKRTKNIVVWEFASELYSQSVKDLIIKP